MSSSRGSGTGESRRRRRKSPTVLTISKKSGPKSVGGSVAQGAPIWPAPGSAAKSTRSRGVRSRRSGADDSGVGGEGDEDGKDGEREGKRVDIDEIEEVNFRIGQETGEDGKLVVYRKGTQKTAKGVYQGEFLNGRREGRGTFTYKNGDVYIGGWKENLYHGYGVLNKANFQESGKMIIGRQYQGEWVLGRKQGRGLYVFGDGGMYEGEFYDDRFEGYGEQTLANGDMYKGQWREGYYHGKGTLTFAESRDLYAGDFVRGFFHGMGRYQYHAGGSYEGEWQLGKWHGQGKRIYMSRASYQGAFVHGSIVGDGVYRSPTGDLYVGEFEDSRFHGKGSMRYANGDRYEGEWQRGAYCGFGKFVYGSGGYYEGQYWALARAGATGRRKILTGTRVSVKAEEATVDESDEAGGVLYALANGKKHGRGKRVWASGASYEGEWTDDSMNGKGVYTSAQLPDHRFTFEGTFVDGKFFGQGVASYYGELSPTYVCPLGFRHKTGPSARCVYRGSWYGGYRNGHGTLTCCDGRVYSGDWLRDKRHGVGVQHFVPTADAGYRARMGAHGVGTLYRINRYEGEWHKGKRHGTGRAYFVNGDVYSGSFVSGHLEGKAKITFSTGKTRQALFKKGKRVEWLEGDDTSAEKAMKLLMRFRRKTNSNSGRPGTASSADAPDSGAVSEWEAEEAAWMEAKGLLPSGSP